MPYDLSGLRVLVTRPKPQGDILCSKIEAAGGKPIYFPTIEIVPPNDIALFEKQITELNTFEWIIFISPQAVMHSAEFIHKCWPQFPEQVKIAAIGAGTAAALQDENFLVSVYPIEDSRSEGLLDLPEFQQIADKKIALICGQGGRDLLADELMTRGALVTRMVAYQRILPQVDASEIIHLFRAHSIDLIISTSNESLQNLQTLLGKDNFCYFHSVPLVVVSNRIARFAKESGFKKIVLATNASHDAILEILFKQKGLTMQTNVDDKSISKQSKGKRVWGFILILIAIVLIAALGFVVQQTWKLNQDTLAMMTTLKNKVSQNQDELTVLKNNMPSLQQNTTQLADLVKSQAQMLIDLKQDVNMKKEGWHVAEANYLVKMASDNLQFDQNVEIAIQLLQSADSELLNVNDPGLLTIRRALSSDIEILHAVPKVDSVGIYARLAAIDAQLNGLPLVNKEPDSVEAKSDTESKQSWWKKGLLDSWNMLRQIVTVRYSKNGVPPLVTPEQRDFIYQNLHAKMENATWGLLHNRPDVYRTSLLQMIDWVKLYFVQDSPITQSVLSALTQLQQTNIHPDLPSLNASLQAFHDYFANASVSHVSDKSTGGAS